MHIDHQRVSTRPDVQVFFPLPESRHPVTMTQGARPGRWHSPPGAGGTAVCSELALSDSRRPDPNHSLGNRHHRNVSSSETLRQSDQRHDTPRDVPLELPSPSAIAWWAPIPLRLIVGYGFMEHGFAKLAKGPDAFATILHAIGVPAPHVMAWSTILTELVGGWWQRRQAPWR